MPKDQDDPDNKTLLSEARLRGGLTMPERKVVALERISDQLALLCDALSPRSSTTAFPELQKKYSSGSAVSAWENEGGSLKLDRELPVGMSAKVVTYYLVGPYSYSDFDDALNELRRQRATTETVPR